MAYGDIKAYDYTDDDGTQYVAIMSERVAHNGGFTEHTGAAPAAGVFIESGRRRMRRVYFVLPDGRRGSAPCPAPNAARYIGRGNPIEVQWPNATTRAIETVTGTITNRIGEKGGN